MRRAGLALLAVVVLVLGVAPATLAQGTPTITALAPPGIAMGDAPNGLSLAVRGANFAPSAVVRWNGSARPTTFVSETLVIAEIPGTDLAAATVAAVTVATSGVSNAVGFPVSPLKATLLFPPTAPADGVYALGTAPPPLTVLLQIRNVSGAPVITTRGFADDPDTIRRLFFTEPNGGTVTNKTEEVTHRTSRLYHCFSRSRQLIRPRAIPVVPAEVLPVDFFREYTIQDARLLYALVQSGAYAVDARLPLLTFNTNDPGAVILDCDQFGGAAVVNVGGVQGSQAFTVVSNALSFVATSDVTAPATVLARSTPPNAAGWNAGDVTFTFTATDDPNGSGIKRIVVTTTGAQSGDTVIDGGTGTVTVTAQGLTQVTYAAEDKAGNIEVSRTETVQIDRAAPTVAITPASGAFGLNATISLAASANDVGGSGVAATQATLTKAGTTPVALTLPATVTLDRVGSTTVVVSATDVAGNTRTASATYTVGYRFVGFSPPLVNDSACAAPPCQTYSRGRTLPVKFQLFDANNALVPNVVATIAVTQLSGTPPAQPPVDLGTGAADTGNRFRWDGSHYHFNLDTTVLSAGVWRIDAVLNDGSVHSVRIGLR